MSGSVHLELERRQELAFTVITLTALALGIAAIASSSDAVLGKLPRGVTAGEQVTFGLGLMCVAIASFLLLVGYLNDRLALPGWASNGAESLRLYRRSRFAAAGRLDSGLTSRLELLEGAFKNLKVAEGSGLSPVENEELIRGLAPIVIKEVSLDLQKQLSTRLEGVASGKRVHAEFSEAKARLAAELDSLRLRSTVNLAFGVMTTVVAVALLYYLVLRSERSFTDMTALISHYLPRISIAVFIELFAFFFLRLYRTTLNEIRAYQGDMTRLAVQSVAVELARLDKLNPDLTKFAVGLMNDRPSTAISPDDSVDLKVAVDLLDKFSKLYTPKS